ncbi:extracellular solute-binding protein [Thermasporomyces composti]|uniref:extracellular solute-binding protein n=1 Tax=Thermasporomyces composti TaxID=696763 RepID=UPI000E27462C|nr:extracellular solute-binding protein [Thermasporomyces composti]
MSTARRDVHRVSRRGLLLGGAAFAGATMLGGCGGSVFRGGGKVRYWNLFGGGDGVRMVEMQNAFREQHPEINLEAVTLSWGAPYYTKLAMAAAGGRAPEVAVAHLTRLPQYAEDLLDPFDLDLLAEFDVRPEHFPSVLLEHATYGDKLMAVPLDVHTIVLYVNRPLVEQAGLLASPDALVELSSPEDFLSALDELSEVAGGVALATANDTATLWRCFWTFYRQAGGDIVLPEGGTVEYDRERMREVLEFWLQVFDGKRASATMDYGAGVAAFASGETPLLVNGNWELPTFVTAQEETGKPDFTMVPIPALFGPEPLVFADSHALVLPRQWSRDPETDRSAYLFISSLLKDITWAGGGHVPAYQPLATSEEYLELRPQSNYRGAAEVAQLDPPAWFSGAGSEFENQLGQALFAVYRRTLTPDEGMDQFEAAMNKLLKTPSPV